MKASQACRGDEPIPFKKKLSLFVKGILILILLTQVNCIPPLPVPSATLESFQEYIQIIQQGQIVFHNQGMSLFSGDRISAWSGGWAKLYFIATGYIWPFTYGTGIIQRTEVRILSPSIFIEIGGVQGDVRNTFEFQTKFLIAKTTDAKFTIIVSPDNMVRLQVERGSVTVQPRSGAWTPVTVTAGSGIIVEGDQRNAPTPELIGRIFRIPLPAPILVPSSPVPSVTPTFPEP